MTARLLRPRDNNANTEKDIEKDAEKDIDRKAISEEMQMAVLNVYQYLCQNGKILRRITETSKAMKLHRHTVRTIRKGVVHKSKRGENLKTRVKLSGADHYWKASFVKRFMVFIVKKLHQHWIVFLRS